MANSAPLRTRAFVLRRTNYGEADRILNLITPEGQKSVIAKGVRKEKSRLAGGIELFCLSDVVIHQGKSDLGILTSSKMLKYYNQIALDLEILELASKSLKEISRASAQISTPEHFQILQQVLEMLNNVAISDKKTILLNLTQIWLELNLARVSGEEPNFYRDTSDQPLRPDQNYLWDAYAAAFHPDDHGQIGATEIKFLRLMITSPLELAARVKNLDALLPRIDFIIPQK